MILLQRDGNLPVRAARSATAAGAAHMVADSGMAGRTGRVPTGTGAPPPHSVRPPLYPDQARPGTGAPPPHSVRPPLYPDQARRRTVDQTCI